MSLAPFSLKDAPAFIEHQFPVGRLSAEAYKERMAGSGQTLTALGSYWKGRKPLILCRAVALGCLLPATKEPLTDLQVFLALMAMDDSAFGRRWDGSASAFSRLFPNYSEDLTTSTSPAGAPLARPRWREDIDETTKKNVIATALSDEPYGNRLQFVRRPEECEESALLSSVWERVNEHLGTTAKSIADLVEQLGVARFGHRPTVADTFCGGGSIPFEAARIGCVAYASDLNPVASMLTWGAFNILGASADRRAEIADAQQSVVTHVDEQITAMGIEHNALGNRAKAYIYCLETRCPRTGWSVPMAHSWVISKTRNVVAKLVPDLEKKRYDIVIETGVSSSEMVEASLGTVRNGRLVHPMNDDKSGVQINIIRGDMSGGGNSLRLWTVNDFIPRETDIWQERLYCIQWFDNVTATDNIRPKTYFSSVQADDLERETRVENLVRENLGRWQSEGLVPDMAITPGKENEGPIRTMGWTHWHHLFSSRQLLQVALFRSEARAAKLGAVTEISTAKLVDRLARNNRWDSSGEKAQSAFDNQAVTTGFGFACRGWSYASGLIHQSFPSSQTAASAMVEVKSATQTVRTNDIYITDPPYADAVRYEEITEFFIAWLRKNPPPPFEEWVWDSRRDLAIKGLGADFRRAMVEAYAAMTAHMPDNGMQVVMFTHQDAGVWADLAGILWAAGLRVTAAWNIVTETESALKAGNYVQGTVCLILRKRLGGNNARRMEIESEIEDEVRASLAGLTTLDDGWTTATGGETLYTDGDLTLAAYAAALRVVTSYATIDRRDVGADVFREIKKNERTPLRLLIDYAADVANRELVPRGFPAGAWRDLEPASRFYVRMLDMEARGNPKVADFQNFAKSFALADYAELMGSTVANAASLAGAATLKGKLLRDPVLAGQPLFQLLFAVWKTIEKNDPKVGVTHLKTQPGFDYWQKRAGLIELADYLAEKTKVTRPDDSSAAAELAEALKVDRV